MVAFRHSSNRQGTPAPSRGPSYDPELPLTGCYRITLRRGAPDSAIRIWLGFPRDPETGEIMLERNLAWQAEVNGQAVDLYSYWPGCARHPIGREEHDRIVERNRTMDDESPFFDAKRPIDLRSAPAPKF